MDVSDMISFCRFSGQKSWPYISMAERKMDSTWLCRNSYAGWWAAISTCGNDNIMVNIWMVCSVVNVTMVNNFTSIPFNFVIQNGSL